jgi:cell wall-associated NlpC family hydrolase
VFSSTTNRSKRRSAVSSVINAGAIGRHAAVMSAASGQVLSGAMSAQAAEAPAEHDSASASSVDAKGQAGAPVSAVVATPQPGDMIQSGHVAIYAGNGQVISGGMNGVNATMTHPLSWLTATAA